MGEVLRPVGRRGELRVRPLTDQPEARFGRLGACVLRAPDGAERPCRVLGRRFEGDQVVLRLEGIDSHEAARRLAGALLAVPRDEALPAPPGHFYPWQLEGADVLSPDGRRLGVFAGVEEGPAHPLWVIADGGRRWLLPAVHEMVVEVSVADRRVVVNPPEGLVELGEDGAGSGGR